MNEQNTPIRVSEEILRVEGLKTYFPVTKGLLKRTVGYVKALDGISFAITRGETLGVVGESGCGKSTLGKTVMRRLKPTAGKILFNGHDMANADAAQLRAYHRDMQMITQVLGEVQRWDGDRFDDAAAIFRDVALGADFPTFLTLGAYAKYLTDDDAA